MTGVSERPLAVVTGASSGIGYELSRELAERDYDLLVVAEDEGITAVPGKLERPGVQVTGIRADLTRAEEVDGLAEKITALGRPVDVLAINAGVGVSGDFVRETSLEAQLTVVDLNVRSAVQLAKRLLPAMVDRGSGRVLFTSSVAAAAPGPFQAVYHGSKAFLQSFAQGIREELRGSGVTVTSVMPGPTATQFFGRARMTNTKLGAGPKDSAAEVAAQAVEAMLAGKDHVVPGSLRNKVQTVMGRVVPDRVLTAIQRRISAPGTAR
ncbi:SDR family NAD(P)-dependent oxidoreductase [Actinophytocola xanthii]|uniref:Oxidoreductase n=1 Tax=Actinophytocola xanthii TaxID=1912961 RepID=A0A1Q8CBZ7_9PSEU|nr:SDR family NAD(P)-dependent oxidoreductase [Actinophytocola xanthii]OLF11891.1 oxidoreductase [Actinophytocola xanthii]